MKIAIALFGNKVSPRFDFSPELWIVTENKGGVVHQEKISMNRLDIPQRMEKLSLSGVKKLICGGIHDFSLDELQNRGIDVFHNVIGEAEIALSLCLRGELRTGSNCERKGRSKAAAEGLEAGGQAQSPGTGQPVRLSNEGSEPREKRSSLIKTR